MDIVFHPGQNGTDPWVEFYPYTPSATAGYAFMGIFAVSTLAHIVLMFPFRAAYFIPLVLGGICMMILPIRKGGKTLGLTMNETRRDIRLLRPSMVTRVSIRDQVMGFAGDAHSMCTTSCGSHRLYGPRPHYPLLRRRTSFKHAPQMAYLCLRYERCALLLYTIGGCWCPSDWRRKSDEYWQKGRFGWLDLLLDYLCLFHSDCGQIPSTSLTNAYGLSQSESRSTLAAIHVGNLHFLLCIDGS